MRLPTKRRAIQFVEYLIVGGLRAVGVSPYIGMFVAAGFSTFWNYVWHRWWIFSEERT